MKRIRLVDAVRLDEHGDVVRGNWGLADVRAGTWIESPIVADVREVVEVLATREVVATRRPCGALGPALFVVGAKRSKGCKTIETIDPNFTVADLPRF